MLSLIDSKLVLILNGPFPGNGAKKLDVLFAKLIKYQKLY